MECPTITDVLEARRLLVDYLDPVPLRRHPALDVAVGVAVHVKHELALPTASFKVRGGLNLVGRLTPSERRRGLVAYSTGNHGQSIAYAAQLFGARCRVVVPCGANPTKVAAMQAFGADVAEHGRCLEESSAFATELAAREHARLVHAANEPLLVAGVATSYLEIVEALPRVGSIYVPVGGGSGAAAACLVTGALAPGCAVIGVQSERSDAAYASWRAGECVERPNYTDVEGLATGRGNALTQQLMRGLADFVVVDDDAIHAAQRLLFERARVLAEGAGAAALAGLLARLAVGMRSRGDAVIVASGGNVSPAELAQLCTVAV